MSTLRTLKKLLFGETWLLPLGVAPVVAVTGLLLDGGAASAKLGGFVLLAGVLVVLLLSVARSARPKTRAPASARPDAPAGAATPRSPAPSSMDTRRGGLPDA
jgi:hypothetical protein